MHTALWTLGGFLLGGCFGFITAAMLVAAGEDAARYAESKHAPTATAWDLLP